MFWRRKSVPGRPRIDPQHIEFIKRISGDHPDYGEDKIALELELIFGIREKTGESTSALERLMKGGSGEHFDKTMLPESISPTNNPSDSCFALFTGYGWPSSSGAAVLGLFCLNGQSVRLRHKTPPPLAAARRLLTLASAKKAKHESDENAQEIRPAAGVHLPLHVAMH